jgi:hypothetical protein
MYPGDSSLLADPYQRLRSSNSTARSLTVKTQPRRARNRTIRTRIGRYLRMSIFFSLQIFTDLSTKEYCIDIVGEDNKSIIYHKIAACVVCVPRRTAPTLITPGPTSEQKIHLPILRVSHTGSRRGLTPSIGWAWAFFHSLCRGRRLRDNTKSHPSKFPGPLSLTQMASSHSGATVSNSNPRPSSIFILPSTSTAATSDVPLSASVMSIDSNPSKSFRDETLSSSGLEGNEWIITVKIADLGMASRLYTLSPNYAIVVSQQGIVSPSL